MSYQHHLSRSNQNLTKRGLRWHPSSKERTRTVPKSGGPSSGLKATPQFAITFDRKQEAQDWANETERQIKLGRYNFAKHDQKKTLADLIDRYIDDGVLDHHKAAKDTRRHLDYFKSRLGKYALNFLTPELLIDERKKLLQTPTERSTNRSPSQLTDTCHQ